MTVLAFKWLQKNMMHLYIEILICYVVYFLFYIFFGRSPIESVDVNEYNKANMEPMPFSCITCHHQHQHALICDIHLTSLFT